MKYGQRLLAYARSKLVRGKSAICIDLEKGWPRLGPVRASTEGQRTDSVRQLFRVYSEKIIIRRVLE